MSMSFPLYASYAQVAIFLSSLEQPFNNWTDRHVAQGFAWREGSVSFAVTDGGDCFVEILLNDDQSSIVSETIREIWVPLRYQYTAGLCFNFRRK